jgi:iron complex outermembrane receptor protein
MARFSSVITLSLSALVVAPAFADGTDSLPARESDLDTVVISAKSGDYLKEKAGTAASVAPTRSSLEATQPQSIISRDFIERAVAPTAEYSRVVVIAPSLSGDSTNGPGLSETKVTMRGFSDDQYNITFDGIPWGDTNNPAHHSTSFFPAAVMGAAIVDRGPGNASNLGYATFGGSINLFSKRPADEQEARAFISAGTWNTRLYGGAFESGKMGSSNATLQLNVQRLESDGYVLNNSIGSNNYTGKFSTPVGNSKFTLFSSINRIKYVQPDNSNGPTLAQVAAVGKNFGLNNDPTSFNYVGYNFTHKATDFEYARVESDWGDGVKTDGRLYTYSYDNQTIASTDPTGLTAAGTKAAPTGNKNIPGIDKQNKYRVYGVMFNADKDVSIGVLRAGIWYEWSRTDRHQYDLDLTLGVPNPVETSPTPVQNPTVKFDQQSEILNIQPYAEFVWEPAPGWTLTPGYKRVRINRRLSAIVNQTTRLPANFLVGYEKSLPFFTINKRFGSNFAVYAQYAQGYQIPDLNTFYIVDPTKNSADPQTSTNYQFGIIGKSDRLTWDVDVYRIDFKNKMVSNGLTGANAAFINIGGAKYQGVEGQLTVMVGGGLAAYVNASTNKAESIETGKQIARAPLNTAGAGLLWSGGPVDFSLIYKMTGETYQTEYTVATASNYDKYKIKARSNIDLSASYKWQNVLGVKSVKIQANVFNLQSNQDVTSIGLGKTIAGDQYQFQAPRSAQLSIRAEM